MESAATTGSSVPMTPMRRLWCKVQGMRPTRGLGKRQRSASQQETMAYPTGVGSLALPGPYSTANGIVETSSEESVHAHGDTRGGSGTLALESLRTPTVARVETCHVEHVTERAQVAIQQSDSPFDAVVITTLPCYPFYCHEDLIKMGRPELIATAKLFNAHLPAAMQIEVSENVSDIRIRRAIETLVGIIPSTPSAPKASRMMQADNGVRKTVKGFSPPSSPLAMRASRRRTMNTEAASKAQLGRLDEVDESDFFTNHRPLKRRKISDVLATPTFFETPRIVVSELEDSVRGPPCDIDASPKLPGSPTGLSPDLGMVVVSTY